MIFFVANDGTIIKSIPEHVYQGGAGANTVYLIAPFAANMNVTVAFKLPTGVWKQRYDMAPVNEITGIVNAKTGETYSGWSFDLPNEITLNYGTVGVQFFVYSALTGKITASSYATFAVEAGVPEVLPEQMPTEVYDLIRSNITSIQQQLASGGTTARSFFPWNSSYTYGSGEIVYYPEAGQYGTFIKSLKNNNNSAPYTDGVINGSDWEEVVNFDILNGLYGLQEELQESVEQAAESAGNAATSAQTAQQAAAQSQTNAETAAESATRAENAANRVEDAANYIENVQSGLVAVPKAQQAEDDGLGHNIHEHFTTVESDIDGLRQQIEEESHFRGYLETNAEIQALSGTPNDYAYSAESGTVWIYQTATGWTNSGRAVPDQTTPLSNATPLMDGTGSAGVGNEAARADHRHPTDTTRASVTDLNNEITRAQTEEAKKANLSGAEFTGNVSAPRVTGDNGIYDGTNRVYSAINPPPASNIYFGTCNASATSTGKTVSVNGFELVEGARIVVKFTNANTVNTPLLNVNQTGGKNIKADGDITYVKWLAGAVMEFIYDGTYWICISGYKLEGKPRNTRIIQFSGMATPASSFGGDWEIDTDYGNKNLIGAAVADQLGLTGGASTVTLTNANIPHYNGFFLEHGYAQGSTIQQVDGIVFKGEDVVQGQYRDATARTNASTSSIGKVVFDIGEGQSFNIVNPYKKIIVWKRTA